MSMKSRNIASSSIQPEGRRGVRPKRREIETDGVRRTIAYYETPLLAFAVDLTLADSTIGAADWDLNVSDAYVLRVCSTTDEILTALASAALSDSPEELTPEARSARVLALDATELDWVLSLASLNELKIGWLAHPLTSAVFRARLQSHLAIDLDLYRDAGKAALSEQNLTASLDVQSADRTDARAIEKAIRAPDAQEASADAPRNEGPTEAALPPSPERKALHISNDGIHRLDGRRFTTSDDHELQGDDDDV